MDTHVGIRRDVWQTATQIYAFGIERFKFTCPFIGMVEKVSFTWTRIYQVNVIFSEPLYISILGSLNYVLRLVFSVSYNSICK